MLKSLKSLFSGDDKPRQIPVHNTDESEYRGSLSPQQFALTNLSQIGIPLGLCSKLAFDHEQSLLAVGTLSGQIKIFGRPGIEALLSSPSSSSPIIYLEFIQNQGQLVSISQHNVLQVWDINSPSPSHPPLPLDFSVSSCCASATGFVFLGTEKGDVRVCNVLENRLTLFCISWAVVHEGQEDARHDPVTAIQMHPTDGQLLLLGYEESGIFLWDLKTAKVSQRFVTSEPLESLHSLSWHPNGNLFCGGYETGQVCVWNVKQKTAVPVASVTILDENDNGSVPSPVSKVYWAAVPTNESSGFILVSGGNAYGDKRSSLCLLSGAGWNQRETIDVGDHIFDFAVSPASVVGSNVKAKEAVQNASSFLFIASQQGGLFTVPLSYSTPSDPKLPLFLFGVLGPSPVTCANFYSVTEHGDRLLGVIQALIRFRTDSSSDTLSSCALRGGYESNQSSVQGLYVSGHDNGLVRLWSVSYGKFRLLYTVAVTADTDISKLHCVPDAVPDADMLPDNPSVCLVHFDVSSQCLVTASYSGEVIVWSYAEGRPSQPSLSSSVPCSARPEEPLETLSEGEEEEADEEGPPSIPVESAVDAVPIEPVVATPLSPSSSAWVVGRFQLLYTVLLHNYPVHCCVVVSHAKLLILGDDTGQLTVSILDSGDCKMCELVGSTSMLDSPVPISSLLYVNHLTPEYATGSPSAGAPSSGGVAPLRTFSREEQEGWLREEAELIMNDKGMMIVGSADGRLTTFNLATFQRLSVHGPSSRCYLDGAVRHLIQVSCGSTGIDSASNQVQHGVCIVGVKGILFAPFPYFQRRSYIDWAHAILSVATVSYNGESCLLIVDDSPRISVVSLPGLFVIWMSDLPGQINRLSLRSVFAASSADVILDTSSLEVFQATILANQPKPQSQTVLFIPRKNTPSLAPKGKRKSVIQSIFGGGDLDLKALFDKPKPRMSVAVPPGSPPSSVAIRKQKQESVQSSVSETASIASQARDALVERGEKLEQLGHRTAQLNNQAEDFLSQIQRFNRESEKKKWWQL